MMLIHILLNRRLRQVVVRALIFAAVLDYGVSKGADKHLTADIPNLAEILRHNLQDSHKVEIHLNDGSIIRGDVAGIEGNSLRVSIKNSVGPGSTTARTMTVPLDRISVVRLDLGASRFAKFTGGVIGLFLGGQIGVFAVNKSDKVRIAITLAGAVGGAIAGVGLGSKCRKTLTIDVKSKQSTADTIPE